jgi:hypothetical protein
VSITFIAVVTMSLGEQVFGKSSDEPRIIVTTDGEIDDRCSMVRFLLYANEWDIEGIIYSSSRFHWKGHKWAGEKWIEEDIGRYASFYNNLKKHDPDFPAPEELKKLVYIGNIDDVGEMGKDTPGSDRIVEVLLDDEPGPVWLQAWGGTNTIARALWKIQHEHPDQMAKVSRKAIIYIILDQDKTFREYIQPNWPDVAVLGSFRQFGCIAYEWVQCMPQAQRKFFEADWMKKNILQGHGPLCSRYEAYNRKHTNREGTWQAGDFRSEGDSPSFMHQIDVGLRSMEHPSYGGWGGRFVRVKNTGNVWRGAEDDGDLNKPIWRWAEAFQNDWAARADWCVKSYENANHPPIVKLAHKLDLKAKPGDVVKLSAKGTKDPDGDELTYKWWQYKEPGSYKGAVDIANGDKPQASFVVPNDVGRAPFCDISQNGNPGNSETVHVICEVTDNGTPPLTRYRRVIVEFVKTQN